MEYPKTTKNIGQPCVICGQPANAQAQIEALQAQVKRHQTTTYCAFCGQTYDIDTGAELIARHIKECPKHPMRDVEQQVEALQAVIDDHHRLVRELDVSLNGEDGAAKQASLCDLVSQIQALQRERDEAEERAEQCRKDRAMVLTVKTTDGLTASEWLMRTAVAEQKAKDLQTALDAEREKVKALDAMYRQQLDGRDKRIENLAGSAKIWMEKLSQLQGLVRALPVVEGDISVSQQFDSAWRLSYWQVEVYGPADECEYRIQNLSEHDARAIAALLAYRATLDATTPAVCPDCDGEGVVDSGGTAPNGNLLMRRCGCREKGGDGE